MVSSTTVAGFDHEHDAARALEEGDELFQRMSADDLGAFGLVGEEVVNFGDGAVEDGDFEAVVVHVEDEVLSHDGEADEADVADCVGHLRSPENQGTAFRVQGTGYERQGGKGDGLQVTGTGYRVVQVTGERAFAVVVEGAAGSGTRGPSLRSG